MSRAQITCGELKAVKGESNIRFRGPVRLIDRLAGTLQLATLSRQTSSSDAPSYEVFYKPVGSDEVFHVGAAWLKNSDRVNGGDFLSLTLTHPDWTDDLALAAYPAEEAGVFRLVWQRPRGATAQAQAA